jgi:hypothetical protein
VSWARGDVLWRVAPRFLALCTVDGSVTEVHGPAADVWDELATPREHADLLQAVAGRYGLPAEAVAADVAALLDQLQAGGFVTGGR